jgi:undecaprenyl-diphosphatase
MDLSLLIKAIIMGIVEGLTEFLPVSSTGHLIIVGSLIRFPRDIAPSFEIFIQLGAILAVIVYFARDLIALLKRALKGEGNARRFLLCVLIAFIPSAIIGLILNDLIEQYLFNVLTVAIMLFIGGVVMLIVEWKPRTAEVTNLEDIDFKRAFQIGLAQCFSLIPGTSRSMSTIVGGMVSGLDRVTAVRFSFYLSIPTMLSATVYSFVSNLDKIQTSTLPAFGVGLVTAFIVALLVIRFFLGYVARHDLKPFAWYRIALEVVLMLLAAFGALSYTV